MGITGHSRRRFLRNLLSGATALALAPSLLHGESAFAGDPAAFASGLREHPWLAGWKSVQSESLGPSVLQVEGRLPDGLAGTLYRNGPAWTERAGFRYEHWFDGDGMVHGWRLHGDKVIHRARMVATPKFSREQKAGRFLYPTAGHHRSRQPTDPQQRRRQSSQHLGDDAQWTPVRLVRSRLRVRARSRATDHDRAGGLASGPGQRAVLRASTDRSRRLGVELRRDQPGGRFGADRSGTWTPPENWSPATYLETPMRGYLHSFAMTDQYLVFVLIPFRYREGEGAFFERLRFQPDQPLRIAVVPKHAPATARWFEADFAAIYHFGDAYERNGEVVMRAVQHLDVEEARSPMRPAMNGDADAHGGNGRLRELRLGLRDGKARWEDTGVAGIEFPLFDPRTRGDRAARIYAPTNEGAHSAPYFNAVAAYDVERGRRQVHGYGESVLAEEHVFVPRPGGSRADDGWLVGTLLDSARGRSGIAVLDAQRIEEGPLAQAWLPYYRAAGIPRTFRRAVSGKK